MEEREEAKRHTLYLHARETLTLTGVEEVTDFDEEGALLKTGEGALSLEGEGLKVLRYDRETGEMAVSGRVCGINYRDDLPGSGKKGRKRLFG